MTKFALAIFLKGIDNMPFMNKLYELQQPIRTMTTPPGCLRQPTSPYTGEAISWERLALKPLPCTGEAVKLGAACVETAPLHRGGTKEIRSPFRLPCVKGAGKAQL